jgi:predicted nucleotidyltransferase
MINHQLTETELNCLRSLLRAASELDIPILAVGATARWLVFNLPNEIPLHRTTTDWDFGVNVADWDLFRQLCKKLSEQADSFTPGRHEHELIHSASGIKIDLALDLKLPVATVPLLVAFEHLGWLDDRPLTPEKHQPHNQSSVHWERF